MDEAELDPEVVEVLRRHGTSEVWHYTTSGALVSVVEQGGLYARAELKRRGISFASTHYYGTERHEAVLGEYVSCAGLPPWGMMQGESEEVAVIELDPRVLAIPNSCFCPGWSPRGQFDPDEIVTWTGAEGLEEVYIGQGPQWVKDCEMFVPNHIPLSSVRNIVFFDEECRDRALPGLSEAVREQRAQGNDPGKLTVGINPYKFPGHWRESGPPWEEGDVPTI